MDNLTLDKGAAFINVVKRILEEKKATNADARLSGTKIWDAGKDDFERLDIGLSNLWNWLTWAKQQPAAGIASELKKKGYYLKLETSEQASGPIDEPVIPAAVLIPTAEKHGYVQREVVLYKKFSNWLRRRGYQAGIPASLRGGGWWGNPDVLGIQYQTGVQNDSSMEVATIEAKISETDWKHLIFEAVSHRRSANRAYFAFACDDDELDLNSATLTEMRYYAELFNIGLLLLPIEKKLYNLLQNGSVREQDFAEVEEVLEVFPAPWARVNIAFQKQLLQRVGIFDIKSLLAYGDPPIGG